MIVLKFFQAIYTYLKENKLIFLTLTSIFLIGIILGCYSLVFITEEELTLVNNYTNKFFSAISINSIDKKEVFLRIFLHNFKLITMIWISVFFIFLIPVSLLQIFFKGFRTGFSIAYFAGIYKFKGFVYIFLNYFLDNLIFLPLLILFTVYCIKNSAKKISHFTIKKDIFNSFIIYIASIILCLFISLFDGYFITCVIKILSTVNF